MATILFLRGQNYFWSNVTSITFLKQILFLSIFKKNLIQQFVINSLKSDINIGSKLELVTDFYLSQKI